MEDANPQAFFDLQKLFSYWNGLLVFSTWIGIQLFRRMLPNLFEPERLFARLLPLGPYAVCSAAAWVPGPWMNPDEGVAQRVVLGLVLGFFADKFHVVGSKMGLHALIQMEPDPVKRAIRAARKLAAKAKKSPPTPKDEIDTQPDKTPVP